MPESFEVRPDENLSMCLQGVDLWLGFTDLPQIEILRRELKASNKNK